MSQRHVFLNRSQLLMKPNAAPYQARLSTPFAVLGVRTEHDFVTGIDYLPQNTVPLDATDLFTAEVCRQLREYVANPRFGFDLPFAAGGTAFQRRAWTVIGDIPCGETLTYSEVAERLGSGPRAVGGACGANPVPLLIPCHRVVARSGLGGFMNTRGGLALDIKRWLLAHERR